MQASVDGCSRFNEHRLLEACLCYFAQSTSVHFIHCFFAVKMQKTYSFSTALKQDNLKKHK